MNIKRLPNEKETIIIEYVSINGIKFRLNTLCKILDEIYCYGNSRWDYCKFDYIDKEEEKLLKLLNTMEVIESINDCYWKGKKFNKFYNKFYDEVYVDE